MSFNPLIPNPTDFLAISQKQLLANFQQIYNSFAQNHVMLTGSNQGQHNSLTMRLQNVDPATVADQAALYSKLDANSVPQMFFRPSMNQTPIQMTNSNLNVSSGSSQSTFLAGPFTVYIGYLIDVTTPFPVTLSPSSQILYIGLSSIGVGATAAIATSIGVNNFTISVPGGAIQKLSVYYLALGTT